MDGWERGGKDWVYIYIIKLCVWFDLVNFSEILGLCVCIVCVYCGALCFCFFVCVTKVKMG